MCLSVLIVMQHAPALAALSHVDDGICLDIVHIGVADAQLLPVPLGRADDASRDCVLEGKGAANSDHKLAGPQVR